ncbi:aminotransferase class I/II-fold pyridoxal phosphate-dependent enzyme [Deinococcus roseus]|uniref:O-acetylhomoserine (Thiol)-lyase/O-acetylserine (Thiol)-lyase n=1 Tax=Deinococcus roseus TaxID=392414 RepID=A0ABQ2DAI5_9DEIO|nr:aminotransferase class I/II-fold pyridoxal phosphate-dependent enzyme [Deinococcus roseus]GGJ51229.1 O-acetylhomoserine (thiol)-lyase/O-acetylserine (thiol)-lyase [Deinococcus roseus]
MKDYSSKAVHVGIPRGHAEPLGIPIYPAAAYQFDELDVAADEFQQNTGYSYIRMQNMTNQALEERLNSLERADATVVMASGQAATLACFLSTCKAGDHIVASSAVFGGTAGLLNNVLPNLGITSTIVDNNPEAAKGAMQENTRLLWVETVSNPNGDVADLQGWADVAHAHGALFCVDNTLAGVGYLCRPFDHGADMIMHSLTKWAGGHGSALAGCVMVKHGSNIDNIPILQDLKAQYGDQALARKVRSIGVHQLGMTLSPFNAFMIAQGLETLELRMLKECDNAMKVARFLKAHSRVKSVNYSGLESSSFHALGQQYLKNGFGAVMSFEVEDPQRFFASLKMIRMVANLGDTRTLCIHPWTTTHGRLTEEGKQAAGVTPYLIRMTVGVESLEDIIADLEGAL